MKAIARAEEINIGFQIAPMIDVVFVIMLFFMVMASAVKKEREFRTVLPYGDPGVTEVDELWIKIDEAGAISLNDEIMAGEQEANPIRLTESLAEIQRDAINRGSNVMVTLQADPEASYQRMMDVLNSLAKAKMANVAFAVGGDDG